MKLYYIILLFTYFKFHISFNKISYYNYIKLCNLEIWISRAPLTYTNSRTVIQTTKKCTTLALQCVYSHTYLMLSTFTLNCGQASLYFEKHSHSSRHVIFWCTRILCVAVIACKNSDHRKSDLWHSFIEAVALSITNNELTNTFHYPRVSLKPFPDDLKLYYIIKALQISHST